MVMVNIKTNKIDPSLLNLNTVRWYVRSETVEATKFLNQHRIPFQIMKSGEGYWVNVFWKNGIVAPLSYQELTQLPEYLTFNPRKDS
jgi:hypothetical protein